jgi:hypothetical protein
MAHRFSIGTQYKSSGKHPHICTVEDQMTVTNSKGEAVFHYYTTSHEFAGQKVYEHRVCDVTIARGLIKSKAVAA